MKSISLYIFWFLHQTTTTCIFAPRFICCISFDSYIKPQQETGKGSPLASCISFDSYIKPQLQLEQFRLLIVVYLLIPTSNHNVLLKLIYRPLVVYLLIPTSNHNLFAITYDFCGLYIFWFLHQTTTTIKLANMLIRCISFDSYIKPQLAAKTDTRFASCISFDSYIKPQR